MNIVKQFEDPEFFKIMYDWLTDEERGKNSFSWGLGSDGELYCYCTRFAKNEWFSVNSIGDIGRHISLKLMRRIVKQFGHLVVFT